MRDPAQIEFVRPYRLFKGCVQPDWLFERKEITLGAKCCYARLTRFAGKNDECWAGQDQIAAKLGTSVRQVQRYIAELERHGLIFIEYRGMGRTSIYRFPKHEWMVLDGADAGVETAKSGEKARHDINVVSGPDKPD